MAPHSRREGEIWLATEGPPWAQLTFQLLTSSVTCSATISLERIDRAHGAL